MPKNYLTQFSKENEYKNNYRSAFKGLPEYGQINHLRNSMKLERNMFNQSKTNYNVNTSISLKLSKNLQPKRAN